MKFVLTSDVHYGFGDKTSNKINKMLKKIAEENPDCVIIAGDIATAAQYQFRRCMEEFRSHLDCDILYVRGNHDLWDGLHKKDSLSTTRNLQQIYNYHNDVCRDLGIIHLDEGPIKYGDIEVYGFDGWYSSYNPGTNDEFWMPKQHESCPVPAYLVGKAWKDFGKCLDEAKKSKADIKILVTHHNIYVDPRYGVNPHNGILQFYPEVKENFDILCCGHTHQRRHFQDDHLVVLNCGSDYNDPKYIKFEVENGRIEEETN